MEALGFALAIACSLGFAILDGLRKTIVRDVAPAAAAGLLCTLQSVALMTISAARGLPSPPPQFWAIALCTGAINTGANLLYLSAVRASPLSLTIPYLSFTPALLLLTAWLILGEIPTLVGIAGVLTVTFGAYLLNRKKGVSPFAALKREKGSLMMLAVAVIWSLTASLDKLALKYVSPAFYGAVTLGIIGLSLLGYSAVKAPETLRAPRPWLVVFGAAVGVLSIWAQYESLQYLLVSYTIAIKRAGMLFSILIGYFVFREADIRGRFFGAAVMVGGVLMIMFG